MLHNARRGLDGTGSLTAHQRGNLDFAPELFFSPRGIAEEDDSAALARGIVLGLQDELFWAVVPPWEDEDFDEPELLPPRPDAPGEFAILAARSFDMPLSFSASYCFSFFTFDFLFGITTSHVR